MGWRKGPRFLTLATAGSAPCALVGAVPGTLAAGAAITTTGALVSVGSPAGSHSAVDARREAPGGKD